MYHAANIQISHQTNMDIQNPTLGTRQQIKYTAHPKKAIKNSSSHRKRTMVRV
jgi:hypothetical protein